MPEGGAAQGKSVGGEGRIRRGARALMDAKTCVEKDTQRPKYRWNSARTGRLSADVEGMMRRVCCKHSLLSVKRIANWGILGSSASWLRQPQPCRVFGRTCRRLQQRAKLGSQSQSEETNMLFNSRAPGYVAARAGECELQLLVCALVLRSDKLEVDTREEGPGPMFDAKAPRGSAGG